MYICALQRDKRLNFKTVFKQKNIIDSKIKHVLDNNFFRKLISNFDVKNLSVRKKKKRKNCHKINYIKNNICALFLKLKCFFVT